MSVGFQRRLDRVRMAVRRHTSLGPDWYRADGVVTFRPGGFAAGTPDRASFAARLHRETAVLSALLSEHVPPVGTSADLGCGYGRLSPWIAAHADVHHGVDANAAAIEAAARSAPQHQWHHARLDDLPFATGEIDLGVAWTVLQHVPDIGLLAVVSEVQRVVGEHLVLCEKTGPLSERFDHTIPRSVDTYDRWLDEFTLVETRPRFATDDEETGRVMLFSRR